MKIIKKILIVIAILSLIVICWFFFIREDKVAILGYHNVVEQLENEDSVDISVEKFEQQIKWLSDNNYKSLSMDEFYDWKVNGKKIPRKSVLITFDDGWNSFYTKAMPILEKYNMKAAVFVIYKYSENCTTNNEDTYMTFEQIDDVIANHKNMQIVSHSYNLHNQENAYSKDYDLYNDDMKKVNDLSSIPMEYYAYPYGHNNEEYIKSLKDNGFKLAFTFGPYDFAKKTDNNYAIPRLGIFESTSDLKFKLKMFLEM